LRTDYVDLLWVHMRDATTPIEEIVRALDDQVRLGKVLYVGISDSPAWSRRARMRSPSSAAGRRSSLFSFRTARSPAIRSGR
jgi:aryl-alcohol dehydrogenase-like predicted oxidoreductase